MQFDKTTYVIVFTNSDRPNVVLHGIDALARYACNDLYTVTGLNGRQLTDSELDLWETLTSTLFDSEVTLPKGFA